MAPGEFVLGMALKLVLDRLGVRRTGAAPASEPRAAGAATARPSSRREPSVRRGPVFLFMLGCLGLGMLLMLIFEHWVARVVGVTTLFAFIVSGVFLIADPAFLGEDGDAPLARPGTGGADADPRPRGTSAPENVETGGSRPEPDRRPG